MIRQVTSDRLRPYVARTFPIPVEQRPVLFDLGEYLRRLGPNVDVSTTDLALLSAIGYTLVWAAGGPPAAVGHGTR